VKKRQREGNRLSEKRINSISNLEKEKQTEKRERKSGGLTSLSHLAPALSGLA
jgi:hypothetical protein